MESAAVQCCVVNLLSFISRVLKLCVKLYLCVKYPPYVVALVQEVLMITVLILVHVLIRVPESREYYHTRVRDRLGSLVCMQMPSLKSAQEAGGGKSV